MSKPKVLKDYDKLDEQILEQIKLNYPYGFEKHLILFKGPKKNLISALPFETEDRYYLVRMTREEAQDIVQEDDDYNDNGHLKSEVIEEYEGNLEELEEDL
ncbi:MAG: hypothetical protein HKN09_10345 [Saprospiraceae bacterium]|nr:hypothetical protein [Saprospiraceae bacterium]